MKDYQIFVYNRDPKLYSSAVTICTSSLTLNTCRHCPHHRYIFCVYLWTKSYLGHL